MKSILLVFLLLIIAFNTTSAQITISGKVMTSKKEAVPGANVFIKDSYDGASTDIDGNFSFECYEEGKQILSVSFIGFEEYEEEINIGTEPILKEIIIKEEASSLRTVTITAGAFEASDEKKAVVLKPLDIVTTAGAAGDIVGALNTLPGTTPVGEEGTLFVRGGASYETKQFIDGLLVQQPYTPGAPDVPSRGRFSPFLFKGTIFSTGGYSAEYGQALSSALILNSQDLETRNNTGISITPISWGLSHTHVWDKTSLSLSANYGTLAAYFAVLPQITDWKRAPEFGGGSANLRRKTSETGIFKLYASYGLGRSSLYFENPEEYDGKTLFEQNNNNLYINTSFKEIINNKWTWYIGAAYSDDKNRLGIAALDVDDAIQSSQLKSTLSRQINDDWRIKFGAEVLHQDYLFESKPDTTDISFYTSDLNELYGAAFVEGDVYITNNLIARAGVRAESSKIIDAFNIAPRLSLAYKTGEDSQVSVAYGHFFQTPTYDVLRNPYMDLTFEKADHYIANYQLIKEERTFRVEAYLKDYKDLIKYDETDFQFTNINNNGQGYARGIDVFFRDQKTIKFGDYWISYSYIDTERDYQNFPEQAVPRFATNHNLSLVYKHYFPKLSTQFGGTYTFGSGRPYDDPNTSGFNTERTKNFHDLTINASYLTSIKGNFTVIFASASNILGIENVFGYRFSEDGTEKQAILQPAKRGFFIGCFISIRKQDPPQ